ncbi:MAG: tetratricopeptide repeat protein [Anaerolineales bacterium]
MADLTLSGQEKRAQELVRAGDLEAAGRLCQRMLEYYPKYVGAYSVLGQVCLQAGEYEMAADLFRRVLGADPEHTLAYASLGEIYKVWEQPDEAIWQLQRAVELSPADDAIRAGLYDLCEQHDMVQKGGVRMTRAALARTYLRGGLYAKAIEEMWELLADKDYRFDLRVALAEALWLDRRYEEAAAVCMDILEELPHCLKANLILGQMRFNTREDREARSMLQKAQALDPENRVAQDVLGPDSPLPLRKVRLPLATEDASWEPPPYLLEMEEEETEPLTIEGAARKLPLRGKKDVPRLTEGSLPRDEVEEVEEAEMPQEPSPSSREATPAESLWLREELAYLAEHPGDHATRLDLARKLGSMGRIDEAAIQYDQLIQQESQELLSNVMEDLTLLNGWHSDHRHLAAVLSKARERLESQEAGDSNLQF